MRCRPPCAPCGHSPFARIAIVLSAEASKQGSGVRQVEARTSPPPPTLTPCCVRGPAALLLDSPVLLHSRHSRSSRTFTDHMLQFPPQTPCTLEGSKVLLQPCPLLSCALIAAKTLLQPNPLLHRLWNRLKK